MSLEAHFLSHSKSKSELESELSHLGSKIECWLPTTQGSGHGVKCLAVLKARYICLFMKKSSLSASLDSTLRLCFLSFFFFFFFFFSSAAMVDPFFCEQCTYALFTDPTNSTFY